MIGNEDDHHCEMEPVCLHIFNLISQTDLIYVALFPQRHLILFHKYYYICSFFYSIPALIILYYHRPPPPPHVSLFSIQPLCINMCIWSCFRPHDSQVGYFIQFISRLLVTRYLFCSKC